MWPRGRAVQGSVGLPYQALPDFAKSMFAGSMLPYTVRRLAMATDAVRKGATNLQKVACICCTDVQAQDDSAYISWSAWCPVPVAVVKELRKQSHLENRNLLKLTRSRWCFFWLFLLRRLHQIGMCTYVLMYGCLPACLPACLDVCTYADTCAGMHVCIRVYVPWPCLFILLLL